MESPDGNIIVHIVMVGWIPIVMFLFKKFEARVAVAVAFVCGWMFLPVATYHISGLPSYTKITATCVCILAGAYYYDRKRFLEFHFSTADLPMLLWCTAPFLSSMANNLGIHDGISQTMYQSITWGIPYYIARIYFCDINSIKILALAIFVGSIVYIPLCWYELIMSPQLHRLTYGYHQSDFIQTLRDGGGFRPMVFMQHGLMTSMWMALGVFLGVWLLFAGDLPEKIISLPTRYLLIMLVITTLMMKSLGATSLLLFGLTVLYLSTKFKSTIPVLIMLMLPYLYILTRTSGAWDGKNITGFIEKKFSATRSQSLQFRFDNEKVLSEKALQGTVFGWGGFGRSRIYDEKGEDISIADGLWIITLGQNGIYGLTIMLIAIQWPILFFVLRVKPELWETKTWAPSAVMAIFLGIFMIDNLLNAMINPIYMLFNGSLIGVVLNSSKILVTTTGSGIFIPETELKQAIHRTRFIPSPRLKPSRFI